MAATSPRYTVNVGVAIADGCERDHCAAAVPGWGAVGAIIIRQLVFGPIAEVIGVHIQVAEPCGLVGYSFALRRPGVVHSVLIVALADDLSLVCFQIKNDQVPNPSLVSQVSEVGAVGRPGGVDLIGVGEGQLGFLTSGDVEQEDILAAGPVGFKGDPISIRGSVGEDVIVAVRGELDLYTSMDIDHEYVPVTVAVTLVDDSLVIRQEHGVDGVGSGVREAGLEAAIRIGEIKLKVAVTIAFEYDPSIIRGAAGA